MVRFSTMLETYLSKRLLFQIADLSQWMEEDEKEEKEEEKEEATCHVKEIILQESVSKYTY